MAMILPALRGSNGNPGRNEAARGSAPVEIIHVPFADHYSLLSPGTEVVARALLEGRDLTRPDAFNMPEFVAAIVGEVAGLKLPTMTALRLVRVQGIGQAMYEGMVRGVIVGCQDAGGTDCGKLEDVVPPLSLASLEAEAALLLCQVYSPAQIAAAERFYSTPAAQRAVEARLRASRDPNNPAGQTPQLSPAENAEFEAFVTSEHGSVYLERFGQVIALLEERMATFLE